MMMMMMMMVLEIDLLVKFVLDLVNEPVVQARYLGQPGQLEQCKVILDHIVQDLCVDVVWVTNCDGREVVLRHIVDVHAGGGWSSSRVGGVLVLNPS